MTVEEAIRRLLGDRGQLVALVGSRIQPLREIQGLALPALTYWRVSTQPEHTLEEAAGLSTGRFQFDAWASSYSQAKEIAEQVRQTLDGYRGLTGGANGVFVQMMMREDERDTWDPPVNGSDLGTHHIAMDYAIAWEETVPEI